MPSFGQQRKRPRRRRRSAHGLGLSKTVCTSLIAGGVATLAEQGGFASPPEPSPTSAWALQTEPAGPLRSGTSTDRRHHTGTAKRPNWAVTSTPTADPPLAVKESPKQEDTDETEEIVVTGQSEARRLRLSAQAVEVIETERAKLETADLGEVLARTQGVSFQRSGGVGSDSRIALNGLTDDQIRFFVDGIPIAFSGYPFRIANIPINFIERVEVYRGVVPIKFGADALGGAINVVTAQDVEGTTAAASYQTGSFGLQRATVAGRYFDALSGFFARVEGFVDYATNDYRIDVEIPDDRGRLRPAEVNRFHDDYRALGASLELGLADRSWADRFLLRAFVAGYTSDLQHNVVMLVPYGDVTFGELTTGTTLRYEHTFAETVSLDIVGGYSYSQANLLDVGTCAYNWLGECVGELRQPGEIQAIPIDQLIWDHQAFARALASWKIDASHSLLSSQERSTPSKPDPWYAARRESCTRKNCHGDHTDVLRKNDRPSTVHVGPETKESAGR